MLVSEQKASSRNSILAAFEREKLQPNPPLQCVLVNHFNDTTWPLLSAQAGVDGYDGSQVTAQQAAAILQTVISSEISTRCLGVLTPEYAPNHLQQLAIPETGTRLGGWGWGPQEDWQSPTGRAWGEVAEGQLMKLRRQNPACSQKTIPYILWHPKSDH